jgi:hypothetical protein
MVLGGGCGRIEAHGTFTPITLERLGWADFVDVVSSPVRRRDLAGADGGLVVVSGADRAPAEPALLEGLASAIAGLPVVVAVEGELESVGPVRTLADVVARGDELEAVVAGVAANPVAGTALALLLRDAEHRTVAQGLAAESAVYSTLQAGDEFARWRASRPTRLRDLPTRPSVRTEREGDRLIVTLDRAEVRNALDARMRDELTEALLVAAADPALHVVWRGAGPAFCSGGDLDEFGTRRDPAQAHLVRLSRSLGALVHDLAARVTVELHGACYGSGIELPAFTGWVRAAADTAVALPEVGLGLVPGAGGTWSLPRRIGRHRTAWLALSGRTIDAATAAAWGLVDELVPTT